MSGWASCEGATSPHDTHPACAAPVHRVLAGWGSRRRRQRQRWRSRRGRRCWSPFCPASSCRPTHPPTTSSPPCGRRAGNCSAFHILCACKGPLPAGCGLDARCLISCVKRCGMLCRWLRRRSPSPAACTSPAGGCALCLKSRGWRPSSCRAARCRASPSLLRPKVRENCALAEPGKCCLTAASPKERRCCAGTLRRPTRAAGGFAGGGWWRQRWGRGPDAGADPIFASTTVGNGLSPSAAGALG